MELNVICSPKAIEFKKAVEVITKEINRQKAEIERLKDENTKQKAVIEQIEDSINPLPFVTDFDKAITEAKTEAIKEFAERLKKTMIATHKTIDGYCKYETEDYYIDNLIKEMAGENNEKD